MEQKELLHKVLQIIKDIENYTDTFVSHDEIPLVEIEIALDKTKILYDVLHQLKRVTIHPTIIAEDPVVIETKIETIPEEEVETVEETEIDFNAIDLSFSAPVIEEVTEIIIETPIVETQKTIIEEPKIEVPVFEQPIIEKIPEPIIHEVPKVEQKQESSTFQSTLQTNKSIDLSSKLGQKPITNIASAIGISTKFQYIKELFKNDSSMYSSTIETLNNMSNHNSAKEYIKSHFNWDFENPTVQSFMSIVERRYL